MNEKVKKSFKWANIARYYVTIVLLILSLCVIVPVLAQVNSFPKWVPGLIFVAIPIAIYTILPSTFASFTSNLKTKLKISHSLLKYLLVLGIFTFIGCLLVYVIDATIGLALPKELQNIFLGIAIGLLIFLIISFFINGKASKFYQFNNMATRKYKKVKHANIKTSDKIELTNNLTKYYNEFDYEAIDLFNTDFEVTSNAINGIEQDTDDETSKSYYDAFFLFNIFNKFCCILLTVITLGIGYPFAVCIRERFEIKHTKYDGDELRFDGKGVMLIGKWILWWLLSIITFGIYLFFIPSRIKKWKAKNTHFVNKEALGSGNYDGFILTEILLKIGCSLLNLITLFIAKPFTTCWKIRYQKSHTIYDGYRLTFRGNGAFLIGKWILWLLLVPLTLGIFFFFIPGRLKRWTIKHTHYEKMDVVLTEVKEENKGVKKEVINYKPLELPVRRKRIFNILGLIIKVGIPATLFVFSFIYVKNYYKAIDTIAKVDKLYEFISENKSTEPLIEDFGFSYNYDSEKYTTTYTLNGEYDIKVSSIGGYYLVTFTKDGFDEIERVEIISDVAPSSKTLEFKAYYKNGSYKIGVGVITNENLVENENQEISFQDLEGTSYSSTNLVHFGTPTKEDSYNNISYKYYEDAKYIEISGTGEFDMDEFDSTTEIYSTNCSIKINEGITKISGSFNDIVDIKLPATLKEIDDEVFRSSKIKKIELPEGLEKIGESVFRNSNITSLTLPSSLLEIGDGAFASTSITSLNIPSSVTTIGNEILADTGITDLTIPFLGNNADDKEHANLSYLFEENRVYEKRKMTNLTITNALYLGENCFNHYEIENVKLNEGIIEIGTNAFTLANIESINFPSTINLISQYAFNTAKINEFILEDVNELTIENDAFYEAKFTNIKITGNIKSIGNNAFSNCDDLVNLYIDGNLLSVGKTILYNSFNLETITMPYLGANIEDKETNYYRYFYQDGNESNWYDNFKDVEVTLTKQKYLTSYPFNDIPVTKLSLPSTLISADNRSILANNVYLDMNILEYEKLNPNYGLGNNLYLKDNNDKYYLLTSYKMPAGLKEYNNNYLKGISSLTSVDLNEVTILKSGFTGCNNLTNIVGIETLEEVTSYAFSNTALTEANLEKLTVIPNDLFYNTPSLESVTVSDDLVSIGEFAFYKTSITSFKFGSKLKEINPYAFYGSKLKEADLSNTLITKIEYSAFESCSDLTKVTFNNLITEIEYKAFKNANVTALVFPNTLENIEFDAFYNNKNLVSVTFNEGLKYIGDDAFSYTKIEKFIVPKSVTSLGDYTLDYVTEVALPELNGRLDQVFKNYKKITKVTIYGGNISSKAFSYADSLKTVILEEKTSINSVIELLHNSPIKTLVLPYLNTNLDNLSLKEESLDYLAILDDNDFDFSYLNTDKNIKSLDLSHFTNIDLNNDILTNNGLETIVLSDNITTINNNYQIGDNTLINLYYVGSKEEYENLDITNSNLKNLTVYYYSETNIGDGNYYFYFVDEYIATPYLNA